MNTVFKKWGNKFTVFKLHRLWIRLPESKASSLVNHRYLYNANKFSFSKCTHLFRNSNFLDLKSTDICFRHKQAFRLLNISKNRCWKCNAVVTERDLVCMACGCVQEPKQKLNHFEIFKETPHFDIDVRNLTVKFRRLQTLLHPDKISSRSEKEREFSAEQSARVNKAYQTLLRPMDRGLYLLELHGKPLGEGEIQLSSEFLADIMEINELLENCKSAEDLESIRHVNAAKLQILYADTSLSFKEKNIIKARELLCKLKYCVNIEEKIKKKEEEFGINRDD